MTDEIKEEVLDSWAEAVPEFARNWDEVKNAEDMTALFNRFGEQRSFLGNSIRIPTEDASESDIAAFKQKLKDKVPSLMETPDFDDDDSVNDLMKRLGTPEDTDGYIAPELEDVTFADDDLANMRSLAKEIGMTKRQFKKFAEITGRKNSESRAELENANKESIASIQKEWGLAAEAKYQETLNFAKKAGAPEGLINAMESKTIDSQTVFWLNGLAKNVSESTNMDIQANNSNGSNDSPLEAQAKINDILSNPDHPYHKGDDIARQKMHKLMQAANPERYAS